MKRVKKKKRKRKARNEEKKKKEKSIGRRKGVWNLDGSKISDLLHRTQCNRTKISGVLFMQQQGRKICAHSSAECVAISAWPLLFVFTFQSPPRSASVSLPFACVSLFRVPLSLPSVSLVSVLAIVCCGCCDLEIQSASNIKRQRSTTTNKQLHHRTQDQFNSPNVCVYIYSSY